jgi:outer membrane protein assembly factor BamB
LHCFSFSSPADEPLRPGDDWPIFLGPEENGYSRETNLLDKWPEEGPPVVWKRRVGTGYSAPSVRGNLLIVHHRLKDKDIVEAMHAVTGETQWRYEYDTDYADPYGYNNGPRCTPLLTKDKCYMFGAQGKLLCLTLDKGELVWQRDTGTEWKVPEHFFGFGCTPILEGGLLIVLVGGQPNSGVVALDPETGKTVWEAVGKDTWDGVPQEENRNKPYEWTGRESLVSYSSPIAATIHGKRHLLCLMRQGLVSLDPKTGSLNFKYWFRARVHESVNAARPVVVGDKIFLSAAYETGAALLKVKDDGKDYDVVWRDRRGLSTHWSTTIAVKDHLYGFSGRHEEEAMLQCRELATGDLAWETNGFTGDIADLKQDPKTGKIINKTTGKPEHWPFYGRGSKIVADGKFIVLGERGTLALVKIDPEKFEEISRASYPEIHAPAWAAPVLSRGRLYLRSEDHVVCLDLAKPKEPRTK